MFAINNDILRLSGCQALFISSSSIMITTSAMIGASLASNPEYATMGVGMTFLAMMLCSYPMSLLMGRLGRRIGFIFGFGVAMLGGLLVGYSILQQNFILYCFSSFVMGCGMSCGQYLRFASIEVAGKLYKGKAISYVLAGGILAAFLGPNLARFSKNWLATEYSGAYLCSAILFAIMVIIVLFVKFPPVTKKTRYSEHTPLSSIVVRPTFLVAVICALTAYGTMNLIMTATPLSMHHQGHAFARAAIVIQWHILGMFVPSLFTGSLIQKLGLIPMMIAGCVIIIGCSLCNLAGSSYGHFALALILLGIGWNFLYVGATQLLTGAYVEHEKSSTQGLNDFLVAIVVAATAMSSGWLLSVYGWIYINLGVLAAASLALVILILYSFSAAAKNSLLVK